MNKLPKEKRDRILLIGIGTLVGLGVLWYFVAGSQKAALKANEKKIGELAKQIEDAEKRTKKRAEYEQDYQEKQEALGQLENKMLPPGQEDITLLNALKDLTAATKIDFQGDWGKRDTGPLMLLPGFPYASATFDDVPFYATYHDFGAFLAKLENLNPHIQFQLTSIKHVGEARPDRPEALRCGVKIIALIQPSTGK